MAHTVSHWKLKFMDRFFAPSLWSLLLLLHPWPIAHRKRRFPEFRMKSSLARGSWLTAQHSLRFSGILAASPPSAVSLYLELMSTAVSHIVCTTTSNDTFA